MADFVSVNGMVWGQKSLLVPPVLYDDFVQTLVGALGMAKEDFTATAAAVPRLRASKFAFEFVPRNMNDPKEVGWAVLLPAQNAQTDAIVAALQPLIAHRHGQVLYGDGALATDPQQWIRQNYTWKDESERPYYVVLAGDLDELPFRFQHLLDVNAAVGRLSFDDPAHYAAYAQKIVDRETASTASAERRAVVFATDHAPDDPTHISRQRMADPLVDMLKGENVPVAYLAGSEAQLAKLKQALTGAPGALGPALVFTASHGLGVPGPHEPERRQLQGALCCQDYDGTARGLLSADQVSAEPFANGSIIVTFACFGAGTPQRSDFAHWVHDSHLLEFQPTGDFVAALPKTLLAHPQGPSAFLGHVDPAWVYCFEDPATTAAGKGWGARMSPFRQTVEKLLAGATVGFAAKTFNEVYADLNTWLTDLEDQYMADHTRATRGEWTRDLVDTWITRNDTQNFVILGDPAAKAEMRD